MAKHQFDPQAISNAIAVQGKAGLQDAAQPSAADQLFAEFALSGAPFEQWSRCYYSTACVGFTVVEPHPTAGPTMAHAKILAGTVVQFFIAGLDGNIADGKGGMRAQDISDTNLAKGRVLQAGCKFAFDSMSLTHKCTKIVYPTSVFGAEVVTDTSVLGAYAGTVPIYDPATIATPGPVMAPGNLEDPFMEALQTNAYLEFQWDRREIREITRLDGIPEGGAKSALKSRGLGYTDNRTKLPEGYVWNGDGSPADTMLTAKVTVGSDLVIPFPLIAGVLGLTPGTKPLPTNIIVELTLRLHGEEFGAIGSN